MHLTIKKNITAALCAASLFIGSAASASQLVFRGQNAALFQSADPFNYGNIKTNGEANRPEDPRTRAANSGLNELSEADTVKRSVLAQISSNINNQIFNGDATSGSFDLGSGTIINYVRGLTTTTITFIDPVRGTTTIVVPNAN